MKLLLAVVICCALLSEPAVSFSSAGGRSEASTVKQLRAQLARTKRRLRIEIRDYNRLLDRETALEKTIEGLRKERDAARADAAAKQTLVDGANAAVGGLTRDVQVRDGRIGELETEVQQLKGPVPDQVAAISREGNSKQLQELVLLPAYNNWACRGSIYYGETFFSFDFDRRASDGECY